MESQQFRAAHSGLQACLEDPIKGTGSIHRLSVLDRIDVLAWVGQFVSPLPGDSFHPSTPRVILYGRQNDQSHFTWGNGFRDVGLQPMLVIDVADKFNGFIEFTWRKNNTRSASGTAPSMQMETFFE